MGVKGGTTSNTGNQFAAGTSAAQMSGNKATTTAEDTNQNINTNNTGYTTNNGTTTNNGYNSQNTAQNQYGGNNTSNTTAGTAASQEQAANIIAAQNALFGRHAPHLGALDINSYLNPYASYALQGLNQNLGINDKRLASSNIAQSGGVGGDRRAVSEALNFGQDQLARGQLMSQIYGQAVPIAQQQQGAQYGANQFAYNAPWTQTGQMAGNLAQLQQTLGQTQAGTGTNYNFGNTAVAGTTGNVGTSANTGTSQNIGSQTADTTKNLTSDVNTNTSQIGANQGYQVGSNEQTSTMSPFQVGAGLLTSALAFAPAARGGRISHKADGGGVDDDMPAPLSLPQVHFANLFAGLPKAGEANKVPDLSGIKPRDSAPYGGGSPLGALFGESAKGGSSDNPLPGLSAEDYGAGYARGGSTPYGVRGYQTDGRVVDDQGNVIDPRDVTDDTGTINARRPMRLAPQEETDRAVRVWRQSFDPTSQQSAQSDASSDETQSDASSDGTLNYTAGSGPYTRKDPASGATASLAPHPESYAEWRQRQSGDSDMSDRYKLPFGLNANKFLLRAGLGILGAGSGSTSNPVTALGKGFTGALDAQSEDESTRRKDYDRYIADQWKNANFLLKEKELNMPTELTPHQKFLEDVELAKPITIPNPAGEYAPPLTVKRVRNPDGSVGVVPWTVDGGTSAPATAGETGAALPAAAAPVAAQPATSSSFDERFAPSKLTQAQSLRDEDYIKYVERQNPDYARNIKKAADYEMDPTKMYNLYKGDKRVKFLSDVSHYDPSFDMRTYPSTQIARNEFVRGPTARTVQSLNVVLTHMDVLKQVADALNSGNVQLYNKARNAWNAQAMGSPLPTNMALAGDIVGGELVKAVVGTQSGEREREEARARLAPYLAKGQIYGAIETAQGLLGGQLQGFKQRYIADAKKDDFERKLSPQAIAQLRKIEAQTNPTEALRQSALQRAAPAIPAAADRETGKVYQTPNGSYRWTGSGWAAP